MPANIKQIQVATNDVRDIEALHFVEGSLDTPAQWKTYIDSLVGEGLEIVIDSKSSSADEPATAASASTMGKLYMVALSGQTESGTYTEFVTIKGGTEGSPTYTWEKIGTTASDLSEYAKKGTYTSTQASGNTGSAGGETITSSAADLGTATGTVKVDNHSISISAHSHTVNEATISIGSASGWSAGSVPTRAQFTYATGAAATTDGTATVLTGIKVSGTTNVNNDAIKDVTLSASNTSTDGPAYVESVTHTAASLTGTKTFNTDAIKDFSLSASETSTDGPAYIQDVSHTAASLTGTTSFLTTAVKSASVSASETSTDGPAYVQSISGSAPSLGGTKTFNTDAIKDVTLSASSTSTDGPVYVESGTTKYMKISTSATSAADKGTVTVSGGTASLTTKNYGFSSSTSNVMYAPTVSSAGVLSWSVANAGTQDVLSSTAASLGGTTSFLTTALKSASLSASATSTDGPGFVESVSRKYMKHANTAASTGTVSISGGSYSATTRYMKLATTNTSAADKSSVGISGGSISKTTRYMKHTNTAAGTGTVGISGGSITPVTKYMKRATTAAGTTAVANAVGASGTATVLKNLATSTAYQITGVGSAPSLTVTSKTVLTTGTTLGTAGATSITLSHTQAATSTADYKTLNTSVAIGSHTHTVKTSNHTHTLGNHTHNTTI